jgi:hypothetical protein
MVAAHLLQKYHVYRFETLQLLHKKQHMHKEKENKRGERSE